MASLTFSDLWNNMFPHVGAIGQYAGMQRLYQGAKMFFDESEVWTYDQTQNVVASQLTYTLGKPSGIDCDIKRIGVVWYGEDSADKLASDVVANDNYEFTYPATLTFYDAYTAALTNGLTTRIILTPTIADHEVSDQMMDLFGLKGIMAWALWNIHSEKDKPWSDPNEALRWERTYSRAVANAKVWAMQRGKAGDVRVTPRWFS